MSNVPNDIFSRLELLKKWQEQQQQRLLKQNQLNTSEQLRQALDDNITDTPLSSLRKNTESTSGQDRPHDSPVKYVESKALQSGECLEIRCGESPSLISEKSEFVKRLSVENDSKSMDNTEETFKPESSNQFTPLKNIETPMLKPGARSILKESVVNIDEQEIPSRFTDFNQLLDEKLKKIDEANVGVVTKPKRPFLKKGTGLVRFGLPLQGSTPKEKAKDEIKGDSVIKNGKRVETTRRSGERNESVNTSKTKVPNVKKNETKVSNVKTSDNKTLNTITNVKKYSGIETDDVKTSNVIVNEEKALKTKTNDSGMFNVNNIQYVDNNISNVKYDLQPLKTNDRQLSNIEKSTWANILDASNVTEDISADQRAFEKQLERELLGRDIEELRIFELLEQKATNSSFCSTSSVIMRLLEMTTPIKNRVRPQSRTESPDHNIRETGRNIRETPSDLNGRYESSSNRNAQYETTDNYNVRFELPERHVQVPTSSQCLHPRFSSNIQYEVPEHGFDSPGRTIETQTDYKDESAWSEESEDSSSTISGDSNESESIQPIYNTVATNTDPEPEPINADLIRVRLEELEKEIETFRNENGKVQKLKITVEKERKKIEKELEEERMHLEEEKKKLSKEKHLLHDRYTRELKNGVNRKEREEITALKNELASVKEELKTKESRYGASQARQRNQIRTMEKEIAVLKAEIDKLRKQNGKLQTQIKLENKKHQPPSDTKVLHEINKNLSLLTKQQKLRTNSESSNQSSDKENDITDPAFESIVKDYERVFGKHKTDKSRKLPRMDARISSSDSLPDQTKPTTAVTDRVERLLPNGTKEIAYSNGNVKTISGNKITMRYYNGDIKETNAENATVRYFYAEPNIWHTTYAEDGLEVLEFPDGQIEKRGRDGSTEVIFPDGCVRCTTPEGTETIDFPDGTVVVKKTNGDKILTLPNGQKEVHTIEHKRREYPDGTVKLLYPDGTQETRYANGRIRLKDSNGVLIMDTADV